MWLIRSNSGDASGVYHVVWKTHLRLKAAIGVNAGGRLHAGDLNTGEEAFNNHRNVGLDQVITWWPNLLNASLYPK